VDGFDCLWFWPISCDEIEYLRLLAEYFITNPNPIQFHVYVPQLPIFANDMCLPGTRFRNFIQCAPITCHSK
jgi:hypothetical protein